MTTETIVECLYEIPTALLQADIQSRRTCRKEILATLEAAPLLGLVPRGQLHAWLASAQQSGITDEILTLLQEGLNVPGQTLCGAGGWCCSVSGKRRIGVRRVDF